MRLRARGWPQAASATRYRGALGWVGVLRALCGAAKGSETASPGTGTPGQGPAASVPARLGSAGGRVATGLSPEPCPGDSSHGGEGWAQQPQVGSSQPGPPCRHLLRLDPAVSRMPAGPGGPAFPRWSSPGFGAPPRVCSSGAEPGLLLSLVGLCPSLTGALPSLGSLRLAANSSWITCGTVSPSGAGTPPWQMPGVPGPAPQGRMRCPSSGYLSLGAAGTSGAKSCSPSLVEHVPALPQAGAVGSGRRGAPGALLPVLPR